MHDPPTAVLTAWANFYVIVGSSAGALTGLLFIVITLVAGDRTESASRGVSTFTSPTVVHFCVALLVSLTLAAPWHALTGPRVVVGLISLYGIGYVLMVVRGLIHVQRSSADYDPQYDDWLWYAVVPFAAYALLGAAAAAAGTVRDTAFFGFAAAAVLLIFVGIHNAWDIVTYIALEKDRSAQQGAAQDRPDGDRPGGDPPAS